MIAHRWKWIAGSCTLAILPNLISSHGGFAAATPKTPLNPVRVVSLSLRDVARVNGRGFLRMNGILLTQRYIPTLSAQHGLLATYEESFSSRRPLYVTDSTSEYRTVAGARWGMLRGRIAGSRRLPGVGNEGYVYAQPHTAVVVFRQGTYVSSITLAASRRANIQASSVVRMAQIEDGKIRRHG